MPPEISNDNINRILLVRKNRMGDMICTLPLLRVLREKYPGAVIAVACDRMGEPIARACSAVDEVLVLKKGLNRLHTLWLNFRALRGFDLVISVKAGFDKHLAMMVRLSGARYRIGFSSGKTSFFYTHPVRKPAGNEHQIDTLFRLLVPLGITKTTVDLHLDLPGSAIDFAEQLALDKGFSGRFIAVFNLSSNRKDAWSPEKYAKLGRLILERTGGLLGLSILPEDRSCADEIIRTIGSEDVFVFHSPTSLELAAVFKKVDLLVTPEGGCAHLAAATSTPAIVIWTQYASFNKWRSVLDRHYNVNVKGSLAALPVEDVWNVVEREILPLPAR